MVSSFEFSDHIVLCHLARPPWISPIALIQPVSRTPMAHPHKSIPSPRTSQCHAPPWRSPTNQFHHPDPVARPHGTPPLTQSHRPHPASVAPPRLGECAVLLVAGFRISAISQPPTDFTHKSVATPHPPTPCPPHSVLIPRQLLPLRPLPPFVPTQSFRTSLAPNAPLSS